MDEIELAEALEGMRHQFGNGCRVALVVYAKDRFGLRFGETIIRGAKVFGDEPCGPGFDATAAARRLLAAARDGGAR